MGEHRAVCRPPAPAPCPGLALFLTLLPVEMQTHVATFLSPLDHQHVALMCKSLHAAFARPE